MRHNLLLNFTCSSSTEDEEEKDRTKKKTRIKIALRFFFFFQVFFVLFIKEYLISNIVGLTILIIYRLNFSSAVGPF